MSIKVGVISDIHSNIIAFRACLNYMEAQGIRDYLLLGDFVSDTPYTAETMELVYEMCEKYTVHILRGNREEYMLSQHKVLTGQEDGNKWLYNSASGNLLFTYERLTERDFSFFDSLPITFIYQYEDYPAITCCHGSPVNTRELLQRYGHNTLRWMEDAETDYLLAAHTHFPGELRKGKKRYFNAGCCGIGIGVVGLAQCLILHGREKDGTKSWEPEFLEIPYDYRQVVKDIYAQGLLKAAPWFISANLHIFCTGIDCCAQMVALAGEYQTKNTGKPAVWPYIEEQYFREAAAFYQVPDYREISPF